MIKKVKKNVSTIRPKAKIRAGWYLGWEGGQHWLNDLAPLQKNRPWQRQMTTWRTMETGLLLFLQSVNLAGRRHSHRLLRVLCRYVTTLNLFHVPDGGGIIGRLSAAGGHDTLLDSTGTLETRHWCAERAGAATAVVKPLPGLGERRRVIFNRWIIQVVCGCLQQLALAL